MKLETVEELKACIAASAAAIGRDDWGTATSLLEALLARHPREPVALYMLGMVQFRQNRWAEAEPLFRNALAITPGQQQVMLHLAQTLRALARPAQALELCRQMVASHPDDVEAWLEFGKAQEDSGATTDAEATFRHLLAKSGDPMAALTLAQLLNRTGRSAEAETVLRRALEN